MTEREKLPGDCWLLTAAGESTLALVTARGDHDSRCLLVPLERREENRGASGIRVTLLGRMALDEDESCRRVSQ